MRTYITKAASVLILINSKTDKVLDTVLIYEL